MINLETLNEFDSVQIIKAFDASIIGLEPLSGLNHNKDSLTWCSDKNIDMLKCITGSNVIVSYTIDKEILNNSCNYILCKNPRLLFQKIIKRFFADDELEGIADTAKIHPSVVLGKNVYIGENVVIEKNCIIGNNVRIDHNSVIKKNTVIGNFVVIGSNSSIGGCGFGYERNENNDYELIPHIGNVVLHDYVEIGKNCCIDKAVLGSTVLFENVKVDNFVHIAHGVQIGKNSILTVRATIAGSTILGENVWLAPGATIMNKITIGHNVIIGLGAVVFKSIDDGFTVVGNPAREVKKMT